MKYTIKNFFYIILLGFKIHKVQQVTPGTLFSPEGRKRTRKHPYEKLTPNSRIKNERKDEIIPHVREKMQVGPDTEILVMTRQELNEIVQLTIGIDGPRKADLRGSCMPNLNHSFSDSNYSLFRRNA